MTERGSKTGREKRKDRESSEFRKGGGTEDHQALRENKHKDTQSVSEGTNKTGNTNTFKQTD